MEINRIKHLAGVQLTESSTKYEDSADFTDDMTTAFADIEKCAKLFQSKKWKNWMAITDRNYGVECVAVNNNLIEKMKIVSNLVEQLEGLLMSAE